jgi:hypothetical protein
MDSGLAALRSRDGQAQFCGAFLPTRSRSINPSSVRVPAIATALPCRSGQAVFPALAVEEFAGLLAWTPPAFMPHATP